MSTARKPYPSDVSDGEWEFLLPYLSLMREDAPHREHDLREVFNALRYLVKTGCQWRWLPHDFPPWNAVYQQAKRSGWAATCDNQTVRMFPATCQAQSGRVGRCRESHHERGRPSDGGPRGIVPPYQDLPLRRVRSLLRTSCDGGRSAWGAMKRLIPASPQRERREFPRVRLPSNPRPARCRNGCSVYDSVGEDAADDGRLREPSGAGGAIRRQGW
jgi:transposase